jgi:RNA polymerase sigma-70 factor (ECF subfamily)
MRTEGATEPESGEPASIASLIELHNRFLKFLRPPVGDLATAEDILQSAFVKAMEHGAELRKGESVVAWFYRILRNAVTDHYRRTASQSKALKSFTPSYPKAMNTSWWTVRARVSAVWSRNSNRV